MTISAPNGGSARESREPDQLRKVTLRPGGHAACSPAAAPSRSVPPGVKLLESLRPCLAYVLSRTMDVLAANPGGLWLYAGIEDWPARQRNLARYVFLHPAARDLFEDWAARSAAASPACRPWPAPTPTPPTWSSSPASFCSRAPTSPACGSATR